MKNFNIVTLVLGIAINCSAQTTSTHDCSNDSTGNKLFLVFLDTCKLTNFDPINVYEQFFEPNVNDDCFCNLLRYSRVFDYLLNNDLDIRYDMLKSPPIHVSANLSPDDPYILEMKKNRRRYKLYTYFVFLKLKYDMAVLTEYEHNKEKNLQSDVNNTLKYNLYCHPFTLKEILSVKNGKALQEELGKKEDIFFGDH